MLDLNLQTSDGHTIAACLHTPDGPPRAAVLLASAMGVPQRFYAPFATWLAARGVATLTFDYRGMGTSRQAPLRDLDANIFTWARHDAGAALQALREHAPNVPITWIGHSLGGQIIPFVPGHEHLDRIITVAVGSGYWRENAPALRRRVWLLWWGMVPALTPLFGYFPGKRLGMVGDLPSGVIRQWRAWCLHPEYVVGVEGEPARASFQAVHTPITALSFTDDEMMSERNVRSIHSFYTHTTVHHRHLAPADLGLDRIGHFGFFRQAPLWEQLIAPTLDAA